MNEIKRLHNTIQASVSPYHCVSEAARQLTEAGFTELPLSSPWSIRPGHSYYLKVFDSTLFCFTAGRSKKGRPRLKIAASHTDWPCFKLKPSPEVAVSGYGKLNTEVYGGPILSSWLDRPLSMAGKVCAAGSQSPSAVFVDFKRPLLTIPNLAIHMNREVNKGVELNPQIDMLPLLTSFSGSQPSEDYFLTLLSEESGIRREDILDYEIFLYNAEEGAFLGLEQELYSAPRLDNLTSVQACLSGITECTPGDDIRMAILYDNEEVGSNTKQGAASALTDRILEKLYLTLGYSRADYLDALFDGFMLSLDAAHALHPNHPEKCDIKNQIVLGDGVALKLSASQSYATDARSASFLENLCRTRRIPYKKFSNRSNIRGGSTLGSISSCLLSMQAADAGVPLLAMHSARELMHAADQEALVSLVKAYFNN